MWADNETTEDLLGFKVHADLLIDVINDDSVLPITIGVFGDWGSGKSSILKIIQKKFEENNDYNETLCIYFNGWTFEGYDDAKAALLNSILKGLEDNKKLSADISETIKEKTKKLWNSINWMRGAGLIMKNIALPAVSAYFTGGLSLAPFALKKLNEWNLDSPEKLVDKLASKEGQELLESLKKEESENTIKTNPVAEFRKDFSELLDSTPFKRMVVIVDDLDRCKPERIIENLEAIKLFLNVSKTAFIVGADPRIVRHAIEFKYANSNTLQEGNTRIVEDYLEKLIQLPYSLPKLSEPEVETYISMLICKKEVNKEVFDQVYQEFHDFRQRDRYSTFGLMSFQPILNSLDFDNVKSNVITIPTLVPLITQSLYGNPRQIKRFLNTYILRKKLSDVAKMQGFDNAVLAKLMILEYSEIALFRQLFDWQINQEGKPKQIEDLEQVCAENSADDIVFEMESIDHSDWSKDKIVKWLLVEPKLSNIDLRDYFWISRDRVSSSISASSLIPPIVKALFNELNGEMPLGVATKLIEDKYLSFNSFEKESFLNLLSNSIKKDTKEKSGFILFNTMVEYGIENADTFYINTLKAIKKTDIDPSIGVGLSRFKRHPSLGPFLIEFFNDNQAKVSKAFNLKRK